MRNFRELFKGSKVFRSFLFSYSAFLIIILCIGALSILISTNVIEDQVGQIYAASLEQVRSITDNNITYAAKTASELMFSSRVKSLQTAGECMAPQDLLTMTSLQKDIQNAMLVNPVISRMAIYFPTGDYVLENTSCYRAKMLDRWSETNYFRSFSELKDFALDGFTVGKVLTLENSGTGMTDFLYVKTLGSYPAVSPQPVLMMTLRGAALSAAMHDYESAIGAPVSLVMEDGSILNSSFRLEGNIADSPAYSEIGETGGTLTKPDGDFLIHLPSSVMSACYVCEAPRSLYMDRVYHVIKVIAGVLAVFVLIGIALAFFFSRRSYKPLEKMTKLLRSSGKASAAPESEYAYIEQTLGEIISENKLLEKSLDAQKQEMRESFLARLVKGNVLPDSIQKTLEYYNIELGGELILATAYIIENAGPHFSGSQGGSSADLLVFSVGNTVEELTLAQFDCFICRADSAILCVASSSSSPAEFFEASVAIAKTVVDFFSRKLSVELAASVSHALPGIVSVHQAYMECMEGLEYRTAAGKSDPVYYAEDKEDPADAFGYSAGAEKLFINCIKSGNYARAKEHLSVLIEQCRRIKQLALMKVRMAGLVSSVLSALMEYGGAEPDFLAALDPAKKLVEAKNIGDLEKQIQSLLDEIVRHTEAKSWDMPPSSAESAANYLRENYANPLLSISSLAEKFGLNRSYLSEKFKTETGMSPLEYLNKLRIDRAKQMITEGSSNFAEIAAACGYYDSHSLNVAFKKFEGVPPSKYRMMQIKPGKIETAQGAAQ